MEQLIGSGLRKEYDTLFFSLYAEHIMRNAGVDELQAGIKIGGTNINNLRYVCVCMCVCVCTCVRACVSNSVMADSLQPDRL